MRVKVYGTVVRQWEMRQGISESGDKWFFQRIEVLTRKNRLIRVNVFGENMVDKLGLGLNKYVKIIAEMVSDNRSNDSQVYLNLVKVLPTDKPKVPKEKKKKNVTTKRKQVTKPTDGIDTTASNKRKKAHKSDITADMLPY